MGLFDKRNPKPTYISPFDTNPMLEELVALELEQKKNPTDTVFSAIPPQLALGVGLVLLILIIVALAVKFS